MAAEGRNRGFHVLEEFVCKAVHSPSVPLADSSKQGVNEGMSVLEELVFEATGGPSSGDTEDPHKAEPAHPAKPDAVLKSLVEPLAAFISAAPDPATALASAQKLLLDEVASIQRAAVGLLHRAQRTDTRTERQG